MDYQGTASKGQAGNAAAGSVQRIAAMPKAVEDLTSVHERLCAVRDRIESALDRIQGTRPAEVSADAKPILPSSHLGALCRAIEMAEMVQQQLVDCANRLETIG